jgi:hypothetical protein
MWGGNPVYKTQISPWLHKAIPPVKLANLVSHLAEVTQFLVIPFCYTQVHNGKFKLSARDQQEASDQLYGLQGST